MTTVIDMAFEAHLKTNVDSRLETTRVFWRTNCFGATPDEAVDPRPWADVMEQRRMAP
jgi:hypothetical protein